MKKIYGYVIKTGTKLRETHPLVQGGAFFVFFVSLAILFLVMVFSPPTKRHLFFFPDSKGRVRTEARYLARSKNDSQRLQRFVDELLLGPITPGYSALFPETLSTVRCFVRDAEAFITLTGDHCAFLGKNPPPDQAFAIIKKNVFTNFRNLDKIYMYIDGIEVYASNPDGDDGQPE